MAAVNGFFGHIQKKHTRSIFMFAGFALSMQLAFAALLTAPIMLKGGKFPVIFNDPIGYFSTFGPLVLGISFILFVLSYYFHTFMIRLVTGFDYIEQFQDRRLEKIVENLAYTAGIDVPKIGIMQTPALNSFACGLSAKNATIVVTQGLLAELNDSELQAVIAHEIVHIANGDVELMAIANASQGIIKLINWLNPFQFRNGFKSASGCLIVLLPILVPLLIILALFGFVIRLSTMLASVSRYFITSSREFIADAEAVRLTHNPAALISALTKIEGRSQILHLDKMTDAMMIDGAVDGEYASHPPISERVQALLQYGGSMVYGAGQGKDTRAFGQRRTVDAFTQNRARETYRAKANKDIFDRVTQGSDKGIFGFPKGTGAILMGAVILLFIFRMSMERTISNILPPADPNYVKADIEMSPAILTLDLSGRGLYTKSLSQSKTYFDVHKSGRGNKTGWLESSSGFVFLDINRNKRMDGVRELITTDLAKARKYKDLKLLRRFDSNRDGFITARDTDFKNLRIWTDYGGDGVFEENEGHSFSDLGITSLSISTIAMEKPEGITVASGAQLIRKARYEKDPKQSSGYQPDPNGGNMFLTSFETDLARYKTASGELIVVDPKANVNKVSSPAFEKLAVIKTNENFPKLRGLD